MKSKNSKVDLEEYVKLENSLEGGIKENLNNIITNDLNLLNKNIFNPDFINTNNGSNLNLDYIPQELFMTLKNANNVTEQKKNNIEIEENEQKMNYNYNTRNNNIIINNNINDGLSSNEIIKNQNVLDSNHFNSLYFNDKSNELKSSKKNNNNNTNNFDFKISKNDFNLSESSYINNNDKSNNLKNIFNNPNKDSNNNIYFQKSNIGTNISKETNSNMNKRYNEDLSNYYSFDINNKLNNNNLISNNLKNNLLFSKSSAISNNISICNGYSDHYINSCLDISNTLTNVSNLFVNSQNANYADKIKLRDIENKEKMLLEMEKQRNQKMNEIIEKEKKNFLENEKKREEIEKLKELETEREKIKELERERELERLKERERELKLEMERRRIQEEKEEKEKEEREKEKEERERKIREELEKKKLEEEEKLQNKMIVQNELINNNNNDNNNNVNDNDNFFITKEKERSWYDYNISSNKKSKERSLHSNFSLKKNNQYININDNNNYNDNNNNNNYNDNNIRINHENNNNEIISYFKKMRNENINKLVSNRTTYNNNNNCNFNYNTSTSFYAKKSPILNPHSMSAITENNKIGSKTAKIFNNTKKNENNKIKSSKSQKNLNCSKSSKISKTPSKIMQSVRSIEYNPTASLQMLNLLKNDNKYENHLNKEMNKHNKKKEMKKIKSKKNINFVGKEKIQEKYNIYFNCFVPDLYEEQREKLINDTKNCYRTRRSKSTGKIEVLEDNIGPNLYNEHVDIPDIDYLVYKTNKKINSLCSLNTLNSNYRNNNYENQNLIYSSNKSINTIHSNPYFSNININNLSDNFNNNNNYSYMNNSKKYINEKLFENENSKSNMNMENRSLINQKIYNEVYNKAFKQFNYQPTSYFNDYARQNINWCFNK